MAEVVSPHQRMRRCVLSDLIIAPICAVDKRGGNSEAGLRGRAEARRRLSRNPGRKSLSRSKSAVDNRAQVNNLPHNGFPVLVMGCPAR